MWSSIEQIVKPSDFKEALSLQAEPHAKLLAGGSYLIAEKDQTTHTLIDINHLLSDRVELKEHGIYVGAGCTLQDLANFGDLVLSRVIIASCPSKNIRNQRTLGGEIAQARPNSDLIVYLHAVDAQLQINDSGSFQHISDWNGKGIISRVFIPEGDIKIERASVIDSAVAFVIAAVFETPNYITLAAGGKAKKVCQWRTQNPPEEVDIRNFMEKVESIYPNDHFGTSEYKAQLVSNLIHHMTGSA
ncbi:MAG: FAD binding domain-containing protein [Candidatus Marinimicrobia bacterium]|nr:FAD binding domain-containing protein [Candidatus Neomarinimicrobiota bacterium]